MSSSHTEIIWHHWNNIKLSSMSGGQRNQSDWCPVISGVSHGTVLEPLLFLLYINDITNVQPSRIQYQTICRWLYFIQRDSHWFRTSLTSTRHWLLIIMDRKVADGIQLKEVPHSHNFIQMITIQISTALLPCPRWTLSCFLLSLSLCHNFFWYIHWSTCIETVCNKASRTVNFVRPQQCGIDLQQRILKNWRQFHVEWHDM